jgi:hypothetical protein
MGLLPRGRFAQELHDGLIQGKTISPRQFPYLCLDVGVEASDGQLP